METLSSIQSAYPNATPLASNAQKPESEQGAFANFMFGDDGFGIGDIIDTVNPLHHIPVVSTLYRNFTGDAISSAAQLIGGTIAGGPMGLVSAAVNVASETSTDKSIGNHVLDLFSDDEAEIEATMTSSSSVTHSTSLSADNGAAALALFQSGELESSAIIAAKSLSKSATPAAAAPSNLAYLTDATNQYSQKLGSMGISTPLADIKV